MKKLLQFLSLIRRSLNGDLAYENYLAHATKHHDKKVLDKRSFLLQRQNEKSKKVNRCC